MQDLFTSKDKVQIGSLVLKAFQISGFSSQAKYAKSIGFEPADLSNIKNQRWKDNPQLIGPEKWIRLARLVKFEKNEGLVWHTANTRVKKFIDQQLNVCKAYSFTGIMVDNAGIGKTYACKEFASKTPNVFYIDCSNCRSKNRFIKTLAKVVGTDVNARYDDILEDVIYVLSVLPKPLLIIDEAGDLEDKAFLEIKRMYNNLEGVCGFYLVGADGLKKKIERAIATKKVGFTEVFSRFGKKFSNVMPKLIEDQKEVLIEMAHSILEANGIRDLESKRMITRKILIDGLKDMRTIRREVIKLRIGKEVA